MCLGRDESVAPEIIVRDFGPARCEWAWMKSERIEQVRMGNNGFVC